MIPTKSPPTQYSVNADNCCRAVLAGVVSFVRQPLGPRRNLEASQASASAADKETTRLDMPLERLRIDRDAGTGSLAVRHGCTLAESGPAAFGNCRRVVTGSFKGALIGWQSACSPIPHPSAPITSPRLGGATRQLTLGTASTTQGLASEFQDLLPSACKRSTASKLGRHRTMYGSRALLGGPGDLS